MPKFTYLSRRQGGVYYLSIRLPRAVGRGSKLCRFSLFTRDPREARRAALAHLKWLIPVKDAQNTAELVRQLCNQLEHLILNRTAADTNDVRYRISFLKRLLAYFEEWKRADPCPVEYRVLHENFGRLREGAAILNLFLLEEMLRFGVHSYDEHPLTRWYAPQIDLLDVPDLPQQEVETPGDNAHHAAMQLIRSVGSDHQILTDYFSKYRPDALPLLTPTREREPISWASDQEAFEARLKLSADPSMRNWHARHMERDATAPAGVAPVALPVANERPAAASVTTEPAAGLSLSQARDAFLRFQETRKGDRRREEDAGLILNFLIDFLDDIQINALTNDQLLAFEQALAATPNLTGIPKEHRRSLMTRYRYAEKHGWNGLKPMSETRIRNVWHGSLHQFFNWLRTKSFYSGPEYRFTLVPSNAVEAKDRDGWTNEELLRFFTLPLFVGCESREHYWLSGNQFVQNELYWAYIIIVFAGMRNSEIGSLLTSNIVKDDEGHWNFDLRIMKATTNGTKSKRKTKYSERIFPVHPLLIDLGLIDRKTDLEAAGMTRLFPEWKDYTHKKSGRLMQGHHFSKSWQYVRTKFGFQREGLCVYSGRHTRASWYDALSIATRIQNRTLGHAPKTVGQRYCKIHLTPEEREVVRTAQLPIEAKIADLLLTAKLRALEGELEVVKTWLPGSIRPRRTSLPVRPDHPEDRP